MSSPNSTQGARSPGARRPDDTSITCQRCRSRKKKCDKGLPSCASCEKVGVDCLYEAVVTDRSQQHHLLGEIGRLRARCRELEETVKAFGQQATAPAPVRPASISTGLAERLVIRLLSREGSFAATLKNNIGRQLGTTDESDDTPPAPNSQLWPVRSIAVEMIDMYYQRGSHKFCPVLPRAVIMQDLDALYPPDEAMPNPFTFAAPDLRVFRLCVIFASVAGMCESRTGGYVSDLNQLQALTMMHAPSVFQTDENTCMASLCLLIFSSTVQKSLLNPYDLVGTVWQMANELHFEQEGNGTAEANEQRRRIFWTLYNYDRALASLLQKSLWIPEAWITIGLPQHIPEEVSSPPGSTSTTAFFHLLIRFRRLQGVILDQAFLSPCSNSSAVFAQLRNQIDTWYATVSAIEADWYTETIFELFLNTLLVTLYRPSRLYPQTRPLRLPLLRAAACRGIVLYNSLRRQDRLPPNYVHLNNIVTMGVSLLYAIGEYEGDPDNLQIESWRAQCLVDIASCEDVLNATCEGWPGIKRIRNGFATLAGRMRNRLDFSIVNPSPSAPVLSMASTTMAPAPVADNGIAPEAWDWSDFIDPSFDLSSAFASSDMNAVMESFGFKAAEVGTDREIDMSVPIAVQHL